MSLEDIKLKIIEDAKKEAEKILKEAEARRNHILKEAEVKVNELINKAKLEFEEIKKREIENKRIVAELEMGKKLLAAKRNLLDEVFNKLRLKLESLSKGDYISFFGRLLERAVETKDEEVILGRDENLLNGNFIQDINRKKAWNLKLSSHRGNFGKGLILSRGDVEVNLSIDTIVKDVKEKWEAEVVKMLFEEGNP
ncbi:MAG: V-type ATP synthase subunit E family protein [Synergistetes bacterium]|nr:V-type ATP synthase subunit E family protein [Synergistota bacterium]MCX8127992.1 V-type ATP synthase subunit E family protein [Synergistota bacterium]MDW8192813.1 V-type ATP synthase subunit E family protein [Synergistota bacterium]